MLELDDASDTQASGDVDRRKASVERLLWRIGHTEPLPKRRPVSEGTKSPAPREFALKGK